jgi:hypothetical protein
MSINNLSDKQLMHIAEVHSRPTNRSAHPISYTTTFKEFLDEYGIWNYDDNIDGQYWAISKDKQYLFPITKQMFEILTS